MINKQTISKLYNGELFPVEFCPSETNEYKVINKKIIALYDNLIDISSASSFKELLIEYEDEKNRMISLLQEHSYVEGFSLGLRLTSEAYTNNKD